MVNDIKQWASDLVKLLESKLEITFECHTQTIKQNSVTIMYYSTINRNAFYIIHDYDSTDLRVWFEQDGFDNYGIAEFDSSQLNEFIDCLSKELSNGNS